MIFHCSVKCSQCFFTQLVLQSVGGDCTQANSNSPIEGSDWNKKITVRHVSQGLGILEGNFTNFLKRKHRENKVIERKSKKPRQISRLCFCEVLFKAGALSFDAASNFIHGIFFQLADTLSRNAIFFSQLMKSGFLLTQPTLLEDIATTLIQVSQCRV